MAEPFEVTDATFEEEVLQAPEPTLVDLWAAWCAPCRMVAPVVREIAQEYEGRLRVAKLDVDVNQEIPGRYGIRGIPTLLLFKNGDEVARVVGFRPKAELMEELLPHIPPIHA